MGNQPTPSAKAAGPEINELADRLRLEDGAGFLVRLLHSRATATYEQLTGQSAITPQQFGVLLTLRQRGALTLTELSAAVHLDRSTLGEMTKRMVERGLLKRRENETDRRSSLVSLSANGEAALRNLLAGAAALQDALLAPIPKAERRRFMHHLKRIAMAGDGMD